MGLPEASPTTTVHTLVSWYLENRREMPWRQTRDPYAIWISETMLQQTRVETVIPYYHNFMSLFPTVRALAMAEPSVVLKAWQGLGYYSRARNLHAAAKQIVERYAGEVPRNVDAFRSLPGVGPYTAGAVFSIAFNEPVAAVDGNVLRVMSRFLGIRDPIEKSSVKQRISHDVSAWLLSTQPRDTTQALMELGATLCVPKAPQCLMCPLHTDCTARRLGQVDELPVRLPKRQRKIVDVHALWCEDDAGVLMQQRPSEGLLASMWQLPNVEVEIAPGEPQNDPGEVPTPEIRDILRKKLAEILPADARSLVVAEDKWVDFVAIAREKHIFTHIEWNVTVYRPIGWSSGFRTGSAGAGVPTKRSDISKLVLPRVYEKLVQQILKG